jgi:hypothetical protein
MPAGLNSYEEKEAASIVINSHCEGGTTEAMMTYETALFRNFIFTIHKLEK